MGKGPNGEYRPIDAVSCAVRVGKIAIGLIKEKSKTAQAAGRIGGAARARKLSAERRSEIAKLAAKARWEKFKHS